MKEIQPLKKQKCQKEDRSYTRALFLMENIKELKRENLSWCLNHSVRFPLHWLPLSASDSILGLLGAKTYAPEGSCGGGSLGHTHPNWATVFCVLKPTSKLHLTELKMLLIPTYRYQPGYTGSSVV